MASASRPGLDLPGVGLLAGSVLLIVVPLVVGQQQGWPAWAWICLAAAIPGFWLFVTAQRRAAAAGRPVLVNLAAVRPAPVALGLIALAAATSTYYALLFTLAQYEQQGLGRSPVASGLTLVPWVAAFGLAGRFAPRVPARMAGAVPAAGCAVLTLAYASISLSLFDGGRGGLLLLVLLAVGGFGLGLQFATLIGHVMNTVEARFAADISGVTSTLSQLGGAIGVAGIGSLYLSVARDGRPGPRHPRRRDRHRRDGGGRPRRGARRLRRHPAARSHRRADGIDRNGHGSGAADPDRNRSSMSIIEVPADLAFRVHAIPSTRWPRSASPGATGSATNSRRSSTPTAGRRSGAACAARRRARSFT